MTTPGDQDTSSSLVRRLSGPARHQFLRQVRERLGWNRLYRAVSYLRSTLWVVPILAVILERLAHRLINWLGGWVTWDLTGMGLAGAQAMFSTVITLTLSFIVFTFGSLLVAIQVASGQMTPRIIATTLLRNNVIKYTVGLNVFTMLFAISGLNRMVETVNQLTLSVAALLGIASLASFLFLIDYTARLLRPVRIVSLVCDEGMEVVRGVYPREGPEGEPVPVRDRKARAGCPA